MVLQSPGNVNPKSNKSTATRICKQNCERTPVPLQLYSSLYSGRSQRAARFRCPRYEEQCKTEIPKADSMCYRCMACPPLNYWRVFRAPSRQSRQCLFLNQRCFCTPLEWSFSSGESLGSLQTQRKSQSATYATTSCKP